MANPPQWTIEEDFTDDWMDKPESRYGPDGLTLDEYKAQLAAAGTPMVTNVLLPPRTRED